MTEEPRLVGLSPKEIRAYHYSPNKHVFLGSVKLKDVPGALANASAVVAEMGLNLIESNSSVDSTGIAEWGFFADAVDGHISADWVEKALKDTRDVLDCRVKGAEGRVVVDTLHYPLMLSIGAPAILIRKEVFADMLKFVVETFGTGGKALAYQLGKASGEKDGLDLINEIGEERILENLPELVNLYIAQGWGIPQLIDLSIAPLKATIRLDDCFECKPRNSMIPASNFIRGHLAGLGKAFFDKEVECIEKKCVAKGDDYCEFEAVETFRRR
ncbi:MAG TPA: V4R domain-containing protein [Nitrososphaerales archaeon]|nr:V4R domain-containing protein [Nitrososphaerales archaeon]